jgi:hypothetical protein
MSYLASVTRIAAAVCAVCSLAWLVDNVNTHGNQVQTGLASSLTGLGNRLEQRVTQPIASDPVRPVSPEAGLDLVDMFECTWGAVPPSINGWAGLWLVTAVIGGLPMAVLIRAGR